MKKYLVILLTALTLSACGQTPASTTTTPSADTPTSSQTSVKKSLKDLLALGTAQKCTWTVTDDNQTLTGTMLINGKKFKQVTTIQTDKGPFTTTAVSDGEYYYSWSDASNGVGMKMSLSEAENATPSPDETPASGSVNWDNQYNYDCSPATVSDSDFTLPTDVKFTDFSDIQNSMKNMDIEKLKQQFGE